ncbi:MAG: alkaline phosphatase family protein, partial [Actinomycetota bacterium]|nr:alkaline phosphatase family protein [Actinomycetota bacterium]
GAADCTAKVTGLGPLAADLARAPAEAPALSVILPDACHGGREGACPVGEPDGLARADAWLREWVPQLLAAAAYADDTMLVITFDQARAAGPGSDLASCCGQQQAVNEPANVDPQAPPDGGGRVGALVLSPRVAAGRVSNVAYNHFALLRTIEQTFGLDLLGLAGADGLKPFGDDIFDARP